MNKSRSALAIIVVAIFSAAAAASLLAQVNSEDRVWQQSIAPFDWARTDILHHLDRQIARGPFSNDWNSLRDYQVPEWYQDAKFGIFIHWGVYSVPAYGGEWYPRYMYQADSDRYAHQLQIHGPVNRFGYKDYIPLFKGENFDPAAWAALFKQSGARYVIPVAEHHDGFQMYPSHLSDWNAVKMGPHRDILGELRTQLLAQGLHFGLSSHRAEHYWFMNGGRYLASDVNDPKYASFYGPAHRDVMRDKDPLAHPDPAFLDDWLARSAELVDLYHPELVYFDWWIEQKEFTPYLQRFAAFYYDEAASRHQDVVLFRKNAAFPEGTTVLDIERGQLHQIQKEHWQTDTSVSRLSWGYVQDDHTYKTPQSLIWDLIDIVSKNGNLLLNVGPKPDGTIPAEATSILREMGRWLSLNGEAIYGTRPWTTYGEGPTGLAPAMKEEEARPYTPEDIRFTTKDGFLYVIAMAWPGDNIVHVHSLRGFAGRIDTVHLLGSSIPISASEGSDALDFSLPSAPASAFAYTFKVALRGEAGTGKNASWFK